MDDEFLQKIDFVAFDTETTGLWAPSNRIVEIGAIKFRLGDKKIKRFESLVNPERTIPIETINIHGITDTMVAQAPLIDEVLKSFFEFCGEDSILLAHNAPFDISFVGCEANRTSIPLINNRILDTVDISRSYCPGLGSYSLISLAKTFHLATEQQHRAADDAALVWKLFEHISQEFPYIKNESELKREFTWHTLLEWQGETKDLPDGYQDILTALEQELPLMITYQQIGQPPVKRTIRPKQIHYLKSKHYIVAFCDLVEAERTFRLDRIKSFKLLS